MSRSNEVHEENSKSASLHLLLFAVDSGLWYFSRPKRIISHIFVVNTLEIYKAQLIEWKMTVWAVFWMKPSLDVFLHRATTNQAEESSLHIRKSMDSDL